MSTTGNKTRTPDIDTFQIYKNDWNYPVLKRNIHKAGNILIGKGVTFQEAMKVTLVTGQCFGLNPVLGVCEQDASKLRFSYRSWRFLYTVLSITMQCIGLLLCCLKMLKENDASLSSNTNIVFYLTNCCTTILFLRIAMKWPELSVLIAKTEAADPSTDTGLTRKCNISCVVILVLAAIEHTLSDMSGISIVLECYSNVNVFAAFVIQSFPWMWAFIPYNHVFGLIAMITNLQCTFNWNFADLFVICISTYLTSRLNQVNLRINSVKHKYVPSSYWRSMREDYNRITSLVRVVDEIVGGVLFISFANNLFFICLQLLHTLADGIKASPRCHPDQPDIRPFRGYEHAVYFVFSFSFLVLRSVAVSMAAARVHTASKAPATTLYNVSSATYCIEIQRWLDQIHGDAVSMSGLQFFQVKRGLILSIAGTIVTYELVLMQFTGISPTSTPI